MFNGVECQNLTRCALSPEDRFHRNSWPGTRVQTPLWKVPLIIKRYLPNHWNNTRCQRIEALVTSGPHNLHRPLISNVLKTITYIFFHTDAGKKILTCVMSSQSAQNSHQASVHCWIDLIFVFNFLTNFIWLPSNSVSE